MAPTPIRPTPIAVWIGAERRPVAGSTADGADVAGGAAATAVVGGATLVASGDSRLGQGVAAQQRPVDVGVDLQVERAGLSAAAGDGERGRPTSDGAQFAELIVTVQAAGTTPSVGSSGRCVRERAAGEPSAHSRPSPWTWSQSWVSPFAT